MKRFTAFFMALAMMMFTGCSQGSSSGVSDSQSRSAGASLRQSSSQEAVSGETGGKVLIAYFSCTGNTQELADRLAQSTGADLYEIVPRQEYTAEDLNYNNDDCRANVEMNDPAARPEIAGEIPDISEYDTILIGYPIWWGTMPRIINTFVESADFRGKQILPFCTSGGSSINPSVEDLRQALPTAQVEDGLRRGADRRDIRRWLEDNGLAQ